MKLTLAGFAALAMATMAQAAPQVRTYQIGVTIQSGKASQQYRTAAVAISFPTTYRAQIAYVGGKRDFGGTYNDLPELIAANKSGLVMNGGFYKTDPATPAGLLLVNGRIISPLTFGQSATLCVDGANRLKILRTDEIKGIAKSIASLCGDGLQSFPILVRNGLNDIRPGEITRPKYVRSILGFRRDGSPVAVFFRAPVHLYVASEFLRAAPSTSGAVQVRVAGGGARASSGLGIVDALNLSGDTDSFAALNGKVVIGDAYREIPSAIIIR